MPRDQTKGKQPSVEPAGREEVISEEPSGGMSGELVPSTAIKHSSIPGFSAVQVHRVNSVINQMTTMMDVKIQPQNQRFEASQSSLMNTTQQINQSIYTANAANAAVYAANSAILPRSGGCGKFAPKCARNAATFPINTLMAAFHHFEPGLQRDLDPPLDLTQIIRQGCTHYH